LASLQLGHVQCTGIRLTARWERLLRHFNKQRYTSSVFRRQNTAGWFNKLDR